MMIQEFNNRWQHSKTPLFDYALHTESKDDIPNKSQQVIQTASAYVPTRISFSTTFTHALLLAKRLPRKLRKQPEIAWSEIRTV
ncbi:hypothetical protein TNCV_1592341 [Trichonephila clavipes]|nr:hypothetical protein TNCV_1592341 [Trichonephila clavipes]